MTRARHLLVGWCALSLVSACHGDRPAQSRDATPAPPAATTVPDAPAPGDTVQPTVPDSLPILLFAAAPNYLDPIAVIDGRGVWSRPPAGEEGDSDVTAFASRWYDGHQRYRLLSTGVLVGHIIALGLEISGCVGLGGAARLDSGTSLPDSAGIATNSREFAIAGVRRQEGTAAERQMLFELALAKVPDSVSAVARRLTTYNVVALDLPGLPRPMLLGLLRSDTVEGRPYFAAQMFVIAELGATGYRLTLSEFVLTQEDQGPLRELFDVIDSNRDGRPELVVVNNYYESIDYSILSRGPDGWSVTYRGGGGGC